MKKYYDEQGLSAAHTRLSLIARLDIASCQSHAATLDMVKTCGRCIPDFDPKHVNEYTRDVFSVPMPSKFDDTHGRVPQWHRVDLRSIAVEHSKSCRDEEKAAETSHTVSSSL
eukprot:2143803-Amphidinium_carterae.1